MALIARSTLFRVPGGDTRQITETARGLRALGVAAEIVPAARKQDFSDFDLLHFFNVHRPADMLGAIRRSRKPYVVSPIFVEYGAVNESGRRALVSVLKKALSADAFEYAKTVARALSGGEAIVSPEYLWRGQARSVAAVLRGAALLLPNSDSEYRRLAGRFPVPPRWRVVPNGIDDAAARRTYPDSPPHRGAVLCMGRIESIKNQLSLVRALSGAPYDVFIHGSTSPHQSEYCRLCRLEAGPNIHFGPRLESDALYAAYASAKVHVLPSFFETTGLSSLEAAAMGCNVVITDRGDQREYFGEDAWYCDPDRPSSIRAAVDAAYRAPFRAGLRDRILRDFTWARAAEITHRAYQNVLDGRGAAGDAA